MGKFCIAILSVCLFIVSVVHARLEKPHAKPQGRFENEIKDPTSLARVVGKEVPKSVTLFCVHLLKNLVHEKPTENVLFSPMSIYSALFMQMHAHAPSIEINEKLREAMKISNEENDNGKLFEYAFEEVWRRVEHNKAPSNLEHPPVSEVVATADGIFVQSDNAVTNVFYKSIHNKHYPNATYTHVDFQQHAEKATSSINAFIAERTKQRIEKFYDQNSLITKGILINTVHFSALWQNAFHKERTEVGKFYTAGNDAIEVPMIQNEAVISHTFSDVLQFDAIELQCQGGEFSVYVVLPRPSQTIQNMTEFGHLYDAQEVIRNTRVVAVDYKIPKMKFSMTHSLVKPLGLEKVFEYADQVRHHAVVHIDERGMEAAAATAVGNEHQRVPTETTSSNKNAYPVTAAPALANADVKFYVSRPFVVTVFHKPTNLILFEGVVHKPLQWGE